MGGGRGGSGAEELPTYATTSGSAPGNRQDDISVYDHLDRSEISVYNHLDPSRMRDSKVASADEELYGFDSHPAGG